jgi:RNA polymerase sigma factor (sigma-70 family)
MQVQETPLKKKYRPIADPPSDRELVLHPQHMDNILLWKAFRSGDEKALITIFERFMNPMYNYGFKIIGEGEFVKDAIQDLFIEIWQNRSRLGDTDSIKFYLFKALRRKLIKLKVRSQSRLFGSLSHEYDKEVSPSPEFVLITEQISIERREKLMSMLDKLTRRQHEAIFLRYLEELNCEQIAAVMDLSKQAVYNLLHHALNRLKKGE